MNTNIYNRTIVCSISNLIAYQLAIKMNCFSYGFNFKIKFVFIFYQILVVYDGFHSVNYV